MADEEKQKPEKPKKPKSGGLSLPIIIGIAVIGLAVLIGGILFGVNMMVNGILDSRLSEVALVEGEEGDEKADDKKKEGKSKKDDKTEMDPELLAEEEFIAGGTEEGVKFVETGRIITNPKGSTQFVVVNLGITFRERPKEDEEKKDDSEGELSLKQIKMTAKLKHAVNSVIGGMSLAELQENRVILDQIFIEKLKPIYLENGIWLRDVVIVEFIIQS